MMISNSNPREIGRGGIRSRGGASYTDTLALITPLARALTQGRMP